MHRFLTLCCLCVISVLARAQDPIATSGSAEQVPVLQVGDTWTHEQFDGLTGLSRGRTISRVKQVISGGYLLENEFDGNGGAASTRQGRLDAQLNPWPRNVGKRDEKAYEFPLAVGKVWSSEWSVEFEGQTVLQQMKRRVAALERIQVPAGEFLAYRIEGEGRWSNPPWNGRLTETRWYAPRVKRAIKLIEEFRLPNGLPQESKRTELIRLDLVPTSTENNGR
ncbi:hypothetical protein [Ottowia testudinis]|uniref:Uncharacterized protein n=1 Tax=Ottowia testudinis TaxID=2816950 RepID=A0A975CHI0_9BURK|nr:hypothetical protein [Ottowia testudinis]QTD45882.1 hypothetical protein J1M35_02895 [Ottowia testudinis]